MGIIPQLFWKHCYFELFIHQGFTVLPFVFITSLINANFLDVYVFRHSNKICYAFNVH